MVNPTNNTNMTSSSSSSSSAAAAAAPAPKAGAGLVDPVLLAGGKKFAVNSVAPGDDDYDTSDSEFAADVLGEFLTLSKFKVSKLHNSHLFSYVVHVQLQFFYLMLTLTAISLTHLTSYDHQVARTASPRTTTRSSMKKRSSVRRSSFRKVPLCSRWLLGELYKPYCPPKWT